MQTANDGPRASTGRLLTLVLASALAAALPSCQDSDADSPRDTGRTGGPCVVTIWPGDDDQSAIQGALLDAVSGDTVCLGAGTFKLEGQLSLATENVTLLGVSGDAGSVLDFSEQTSGANGILLSADHDTVEALRILNPKGDGVRATAVDYPTFRNVHVEWTEGPSETNGGYGLYPVESSHVLIEHSFVSGASDAGIYVGQSRDIVVRDNEVTGNVAGIEIENSTDAEVYGNHAHGNTGGILVFNLPGLAVKDGKRANVHDNEIEDNNLANFAAEGNIVHDLPAGTGVFILASDDNELHANVIRGHVSTGISVISWALTLRDSEGEKDPEYDWFPERNYVHDNQLADNGTDPQDNSATIATVVGLEQLPDLVWDGIFNTDDLDEPSAVPPESLRNCFADNGDATFMNLDVGNNGAGKSDDITPYNCTREPLAAIEL